MILISFFVINRNRTFITYNLLVDSPSLLPAFLSARPSWGWVRRTANTRTNCPRGKAHHSYRQTS
jgi:hypothetical protein